jgi:hypothetical protein
MRKRCENTEKILIEGNSLFVKTEETVAKDL